LDQDSQYNPSLFDFVIDLYYVVCFFDFDLTDFDYDLNILNSGDFFGAGFFW